MIARDMASVSYTEFMRDIRNRYTLRLALIEIVEAAADLGLYLLKEIAGVRRIRGYSEIFKKLVEHGILSNEVGTGMEKLARLRNLIIHRYWDVNDARIYEEAKDNGLKIIESFIKEVMEYASRDRD